jgi:acyl-CoA reductase-like NAD-dependent aldehyde dehydrogenase
MAFIPHVIDGQALTGHPGVDRITFTGESATGRVIARAAAFSREFFTEPKAVVMQV